MAKLFFIILSFNLIFFTQDRLVAKDHLEILWETEKVLS